MKSLLIMLLLAAGLSPAAAAWKIALPVDATAVETKAAAELRHYLGAIFKTELPVVHGDAAEPVIKVGLFSELELDAREWKQDEIVVSRSGDTLYLAGARPRGTLYAVYEFLEAAYGVRFWTADAESIPEFAAFFVPDAIDIRQAPVFFWRENFTDRVMGHPAFAIKNRSNGHYTGIPEEWGGNQTILGFCHTFFLFLPPEKYFREHPEWYSLFSGKRMHGQLCLSNMEMRRELVRNVLEELRRNPETEIVSVSQNDNGFWCECDDCAGFIAAHGNLSDLLLDAVNQVAAAVGEEFPAVKVETLAYNDTRMPPATIRPAANIIVRLCSIECDFSKPLQSAANAEFAANLEAWGKLAAELYIWNYVTNFTEYYQPMPNWHTLEADLQFFAANRVSAVFEQGSAYGGGIADLADLRAYVIGKLLWNPELDTDRLIDEFLAGYYGPAATGVRRYIDLVSKAGAAYSGKVGCFAIGSTGWLDDASVWEARQALNDAAAEVADNPELTRRLAEAAAPINFVLLERPELSPADWKSLLEKQLAIAERSGTKHFSEDPANNGERQWQRFAKLHGVTAIQGEAPAVAAGKKWLAFNAADETVYYKDIWAFIEDDPEAASGRSVRLACENAQWVLQVQLPPAGDFDIYAEVKCDADASDEDLLELGFHPGPARYVPVSQIAGPGYKLVKFPRFPTAAGTILYVASRKNPEVTNLRVSRFIFVER